MNCAQMNPYMRYAALQPSVLSEAPLKFTYDCRIFFVLSGEASFVMKERSIPLKVGDFIYVPPKTPYHFDGKVKVIVLNFDLDRTNQEQKSTHEKIIYNKDLHKDIRPLTGFDDFEEVISLKDAFFLENSLQTCVNHNGFPTDISDALTSALIKQMLSQTLSYVKQKDQLTPPLVEKAIAFIRRNYDKNITNEEIAKEIGYHSFYINRLLKKHTGKTMHRLIIQERTNIAKQLLVNTSMTIESISDESGFGNRVKFCTMFKKETGFSPTLYRNRFSKNENTDEIEF